MADIEVRDVDERVVEALKAKAQQRGVSLEDEIRTILTRTVDAGREELLRRADAIRARTKLCTRPELDSARIIREERDAWG
jgi:plasmid stability protein